MFVGECQLLRQCKKILRILVVFGVYTHICIVFLFSSSCYLIGIKAWTFLWLQRGSCRLCHSIMLCLIIWPKCIKFLVHQLMAKGSLIYMKLIRYVMWIINILCWLVPSHHFVTETWKVSVSVQGRGGT